VRNPHYPVVPPVQEVKSHTSPLKVSGDAVSLYDYVGNAVIAGMLNHPEKYPAVFFANLLIHKFDTERGKTHTQGSPLTNAIMICGDDNKQIFPDIIFFHAQQSAEKYLKAYLVFQDHDR
jgi:hypothetical protein